MSDNHAFTSSQTNLPPRSAATDPLDQVFSAVTSAAAGSASLWATYPSDQVGGAAGAPPGKIWLELEATAFDCYVRFARTATTATTAANGAVCRVGTPRVFFLDPTKDLFLDVLSGGAGTIKWRTVSRIADRSRA